MSQFPHVWTGREVDPFANLWRAHEGTKAFRKKLKNPSTMNGDVISNESEVGPNDSHSDVTSEPATSTNGSVSGDHVATDEELVCEPFVLPEVYDEDEIDGWTNNAFDIYKDYYDEHVFEAVTHHQFKDARSQSRSIMADLSVRFKKVQMGLFNKSGPISHTSDQAHPRSVGGVGFATVVNNIKFPHHDFFRPGRCFRLRLRHSNLSFRDDTCLDGRVACIKFADDDQGGPLDLILFTGRVAPYHNAKAFEEFLEDYKEGEEGIKKWVFKQPSNLFGRIDTIRRMPSSYYDQRYYSHVIYNFLSSTGERKLAKLRLIPADASQETGLPTDEDQKEPWNTKGKDTSQPKDYLRQEYTERLAATPMQYRLQIQVRDYIREELCESSNPCLMWDKALYPWEDLAILTIALPISEQVLAKTKFNLLNHPPTFGLQEMRSVDEFSSLGHVMAETHGCLEKGFVKPAADDIDEMFKAKFHVLVVTGHVGKAGTDADVFITITGSKARSKPVSLDTAFHDDFESGQKDEFDIEVDPVGDVTAIDMEIKGTLLSKEWFLDYVEVTDVATETTAKFPCYQWLTQEKPKVLLRRAEAILIHQELSPFSYLQRKFELEERKELFAYERVKLLPSRMKTESYDSLPKKSKLHAEKVIDLRGKYMRTLANTGVSTIKSIFQNWDALNDYMILLTNVLKDKKTVKKVANVWKEDAEFGRQCLNGVHPTRIRRCTKIPKNFPVTNEMVGNLLDRGNSLEEEIKAGHIYILNYPELDKIEAHNNAQTKVKRYLVAPLCLLYVRQSGDLVPIAIQLHQTIHTEELTAGIIDEYSILTDTNTDKGKNPIWTPNDDENDWLYAKMWVREADAQLHQIVSRHLLTHLVIETVCVSTFRNLPTVHPVFKILIPHLRYTIAVNVLGRQSLYPAEDGLFDKYLAIGRKHDQLLQEAYKVFKWSQLNLPKKLAERGVMDREKLPNYYYRDDALALWKIISKYVRTVVMVHYWTNENVRNDKELHSWIHDLHTEGFPVQTRMHDVPDSFQTTDQLIQFITEIIFTASCQNAALTAGMMDYYAFCPNAPTMLNEPPPTEKGHTTLETILKALPSRQKTAEIIAACYTLSKFSRDELFLGEFPNDHFHGELVESAITAFREDMQTVSEQIKERNENLEFPYTYLLPDQIPNSIAN